MDETPGLRIDPDWFSLTWVAARVAMLTEPHVGALLRANVWFVRGRERDLVLDTGNGIAPLRPLLERLAHGRRRELVAVATHAHVDHMGGLHEFEHRLFHRLEREAAASLGETAPLVLDNWPKELRSRLAENSVAPPPLIVDAVPDAAFEPATFRVTPSVASRFVEGGDVIDLGDRQLLVLHLPGHTPGSIGLLDRASGALFSGDAVYDGGLIDTLPGSDVVAYVQTMALLRDLPVEVVYPGHDEPFGRERLRVLAERYLRRRG